jgi:glycosyltransferase involved in cell wall biosynthesis
LAQSDPSKGLPSNASAIKEQLKARPSFLMVGTLEPRKGYTQALRAFEQLWEQGDEVNLTIVGRQGWMVEELASTLMHHPENGKRLFWLDKVSDEFLEQLYEHSHCLVAASEAEGFGLPLIEAAQQRLPLIARDIPVFREVAANQAVYFKGDEPEALADAVKGWLELYRSETVPDSGNLPWLSWEESGEQLLSTIRDAKWYFEYPDRSTGH